MKPTIAIVGCGRVGTNFGIHLKNCGYTIAGLADKNIFAAKKAAELIDTDLFSAEPESATASSDIILITTPDDIIESECENIANGSGFKPGQIVFHSSGSLPSTILASAADSGAETGSIHPLQSFSAPETARNPFKGIIMSVEGSDPAVKAGKSIASDLQATCYTIRTDSKTLYHAAAVVASNYLVTLVEMSFKLLSEAGIPEQDAYQVLSPLIQGTLTNISNSGPGKALTGPIARGDIDTVRHHIEEISLKLPELKELYKILGTNTVDIALSSSGLADNTVQSFRDLFGKD